MHILYCAIVYLQLQFVLLNNYSEYTGLAMLVYTCVLLVQQYLSNFLQKNRLQYGKFLPCIGGCSSKKFRLLTWQLLLLLKSPTK